MQELKMELLFLVYLITTINIILSNTTPQQKESNRLARSLLEKVLYSKTKTQSTLNHHSTGLQNSFGISGNVGVGFHFGSGYRIKNGDGKDEQQIVHSKIYDKYLGTSFGFGSLGNINKGHINNIEQSVLEDQNNHNENHLSDQEYSNETIPTGNPRPGVFRKISNYWSGEHLEPKSNFTSNGIFQWNLQKFKNKNNIGTPR